MIALNLYAGLGGNRKLWNCPVAAVEKSPKIAAVYKRLFPQDAIFEKDAHQQLLSGFDAYDFIWSSPPCQSHGRMVKASRHKPKGYPDLRLYEEIIFLQNFCKVPWVVENVAPYYEPLIAPTKRIGRHLFWSNFEITDFEPPKPPADFINLCNLEGKRKLMDWLGVHFEENIYYEGNHCPAQVLRNCVHPLLGLHVFECAMASLMTPSQNEVGG